MARKSNHKKSYFGHIAITIFIVVLLVLYFYFTSDSYQLKVRYTDCVSAMDDQAKHILAIKNSDAQLCQQLQDEEYKKYCLAEVTQDRSYCQGLDMFEKEAFCVFPITKKMSDCTLLESEAYCYGRLNDDPSRCIELQQMTGNERDKIKCEAWVNLDPTLFRDEQFATQNCEDVVWENYVEEGFDL